MEVAPALRVEKKRRTKSLSSPEGLDLSRRERQILEVLYQRGEATGREVQERLTTPPSYSAVRTTLRILERKGIVRHRERCLRYVFFPAIEREQAKRSALLRLVRTYFENSIEDIVSTLLHVYSTTLTGAEIDRIAALLENARSVTVKTPR